MLLYSNTIITFIKNLKQDLRLIMKDEMNLSLRRTRFEYNGYLVPIEIVVFEHPSTLGYFEHNNYRIGINKKLMYQAKKETIKNILRHEMIHFLAWLEYGDKSLGHGEQYRLTAKKYGFGEKITLAHTSVELENMMIKGDIKSEQIILKIKKLLKLAASDNKHEAELATIKANELLLKHNIEKLSTNALSDEEICVKRILTGKRNNEKYRAIYEILKTFFVAPVFNHCRGIFYLEVTGTRTNVEMTDYVANFLYNELERLYKEQRKKDKDIKKGPFMKGIAAGYILKIKSVQSQNTSEKELITLNCKLRTQLKMVYTRLSSNSFYGTSHHEKSMDLGKEAGKRLSINPGIQTKNDGMLLLS